MKSALSLVIVGCSLLSGLALMQSGCGGSVDSEGGGGASANEGQGGSKQAAPCTADSECSGGRCVQGACRKLLKVGGIMAGTSSVREGRTLCHVEGITEAANSLGYVQYRFAEGLSGESVIPEVDRMVTEEGRELIIFDSFEHRAHADTLTKKYPNVKFLAYGVRPQSPNLGSFDARIAQAWYVAGQVAAMTSRSKRLGFVGSYITPENVRAINAFMLGASSVVPEVKVEVRWMGFWFDYNAQKTFEYTPRFLGPGAQQTLYYAEEYAAAQLIDGGADILAHTAEDRRVDRLVESAGPMFEPDGVTPLQVHTIVNGNSLGYVDAITLKSMTTALGSVYWYWAPVYARVFEDFSAGKWQPFDINEPLSEPLDRSVVGLSLNPTSQAGIDPAFVESRLRSQAKAGYASVFQGPYETTGQRDSVALGETLSDKELRQMCWFAKGVVEKANPLDVASPDVDARVPTTAHPAPAEVNPQSGAYVLLQVAPGVPRGVGWNCDENQIPE